MSSDFDTYLEEHLKGGERDSSGQFTLDREAALSKIAQYRFPYENAWVLKVAQAAVLSGSEWLDIRQTDSATEFRFSPRQSWSGQEFIQEFSNPGVTLEPAQEALRAGLWSVGVGKHRPFQLSFPAQPSGCLWDGERLVATQEAWMEELELIVSHRVRQAGQELPLVRDLKSALINREILNAIKTGLYTAPLKLVVNGKRMDGFQFCPDCGFTKFFFPLRAFALDLPEFPPLRFPPGFRVNLHPEISSKYNHFWEFFDVSEACKVAAPAALALLSAAPVGEIDGCLYWVRAGVVVQKEVFSQVGRGRTSLNLFVNADHLPTDLSGFSLLEQPAGQHRLQICQAVTREMRIHQLDSRLEDRQQNRRLTLTLMATGATGLILGLTVAPAAAALIPCSIVTRILLGRKGDLDFLIWQDLHRLIRGWAKAYPDPDGFDPVAELKQHNYYRGWQEPGCAVTTKR